MKIMLDFSCICGKTTEHFVDSGTTYIPCECGQDATRMISAPTIHLEGISGAFPGAADKWANMREQKARIHAKRNG